MKQKNEAGKVYRRFVSKAVVEALKGMQGDVIPPLLVKHPHVERNGKSGYMVPGLKSHPDAEVWDN